MASLIFSASSISRVRCKIGPVSSSLENGGRRRRDEDDGPENGRGPSIEKWWAWSICFGAEATLPGRIQTSQTSRKTLLRICRTCLQIGGEIRCPLLRLLSFLSRILR